MPSYAIDVELPNEVNALALMVHSLRGNGLSALQISERLGISEHVVTDTMFNIVVMHLTHDNIMTLVSFVEKNFRRSNPLVDIEGFVVYETRAGG